MIPAGVQVFAMVEPVSMRFGFERLTGLVQDKIGYDVRSEALFLFVSKQRKSLKILFFDGTGLCLFYKRLDNKTFELPEPDSPDANHVEINEELLESLLNGIELSPKQGARTKPKRLPRMH